MGKVFTITEGLENMGALRTGGQGSVYKGRRVGHIYVAVKILPTPIHTESDDDKNFRDFTNEVEKLKKVNEKPTPHVVKILNSGITESGSLPFIEMEFIEGPDLGELLNEPHDPVFTISEVIKVAEQLASALAHCHNVSVKHGDIKSNNVKFNVHTGNYVLLDFGLAIMSDEQRRDSLKNAGAVEFMAPEQNEGTMLPQSDVYSYGIILYELLAGVVPFQLTDNGNSARNNVMISHIETPVPDLLELRERNMPNNWPTEKKKWEMQVPEWLLSLIDKCLQKDPANRFANGEELHQAILHQHGALAVKNDTERALILQSENEILQASLQHIQQELKQLRNQPKPTAVPPVQTVQPIINKSARPSKPALFIAALLLICIGAFAGHSLFPKKEADIAATADKKITTSSNEKIIPAVVKKKKDSVRRSIHKLALKQPAKTPVVPVDESNKGSDVGKIFSLFATYAYFHDRPDAESVRKANINRWNNARLTALDDQNGYIYVVYKNEQGQVSKGWLDKKDLIKVGGQ
jgi:serine/threonine protein kinase